MTCFNVKPDMSEFLFIYIWNTELGDVMQVKADRLLHPGLKLSQF